MEIAWSPKPWYAGSIPSGLAKYEVSMPKTEISLSPRAVETINEILTNGKEAQIAVRNNRLIVWEVQSKKKYEVVVTPPR